MAAIGSSLPFGITPEPVRIMAAVLIHRAVTGPAESGGRGESNLGTEPPDAPGIRRLAAGGLGARTSARRRLSEGVSGSVVGSLAATSLL